MVQRQNLKENRNNCLYGLEKAQVSLALRKAWSDYYNFSKEQVPDKKRIRQYKRVIHKLQDKLGIAPTEFRQLEVVGLWFYKLNPELFREEVTYDMIEKGMIKTVAIVESRMRLDKRPNMVQEMIRWDSELRKYIAETGIANKSDASPNTPGVDESNL
jgi:hypothetical protein